MAQYFITEYYVKTATTVSANVDAKSISPHLATSSDMFIKKILKNSDGSNTFYDYLLSAYISQTLTSDELTLVGYIKPALAWRVASNTTSALYSQITNKGPQLQNGDNSTQVQNSDLYYLINTLEKNAEFYQQELVDYMTKFKLLYTGYTGSIGLVDQYDSGVGIYPEGRGGCSCGLNYGRGCTCGRSIGYGNYF